jgi:polar amino acid transport system permease protein
VSGFVALLKDSSLARAIGVVERTNVGNCIQSAPFQSVVVGAGADTLFHAL